MPGAPAPYGTPPGYGQPAPYGLADPTGKPPRPAVRVGAILVLVGSVMVFVGAFVPWLSARGEQGNGFDDWLTVDSDGVRDTLESPGSGWVVFAVVLLGFAITLLVAGRVLAVAILAIVFSGITLAVVGASASAVSDTKDYLGEGTWGAGIPLGLAGVGLCLGGSIAATAKRRRWR